MADVTDDEIGNLSITMKEAYIGDQVHMKCPMGKYIQPLTVTNNKNVVMQGIKVATEKDNEVGQEGTGKNIPFKAGEGVFGNPCAKCGGQCAIPIGTKVKWQNVNPKVSIGDAKTLNGKSYFMCPIYPDVKIELVEHNQNNFDFSEENKAISEEEEKTPSPLELFNMLKDLAFDPKKRKAMVDRLRNQLNNELKYANEIAGHLANNTGEGFKDIDAFLQNPNIDTMKEAFNSGSKMMESLGISQGLINSFAEESQKKMSKLMDEGVPKEKILDEIISLGDKTVDNYVDGVLSPTNGKNVSPEAKKWYKDSLKQVLLGAGTKENTLFGSALEIGAGMIPPLGVAMDVRDTLISGLKGDFWGTFYSFLGLIPVIGDLVKKSPALMKMINKLSTRASDLLKIAGDKSQLVAKMTDVGKSAIKNVKAFKRLIGEAQERLEKAIAKLNPKSMIVAKLDEVGMKLKKKLCEMEIIPGCFVAGTLIKMKGGGYKRIEDIEIGDYVLSYNEDEQTEEYQKVYKTFKNTVSTTLEIKFKNGISVETTLNHLFYLKDTGYVEAWKLEKNNKIFSINKYEEIEEIYEKEYFVKDIYNFSVERNNNYYISELDLLVHNKGETCADQLKKIRGAIDDAVTNDADILKGKRKGLKEDKYEELMSACFTEGTKVFSRDNLKIDEIEKGDFVYSYNFEKEKIEEKEVLTIFKSKVNKIIKLTLKNTKTNLTEDIETTPEHLFYTNGNYRLAKYLKVGDELKSFNNEIVEIVNIETKKSEKEIFVYNIEVKDNHNYFVGENRILVHNEKRRYKYDDVNDEFIVTNSKGEKIETQKKLPKELENSPKQSRDTETHLKNGGEIVIDDEGMWKMGLPSTNKLTGKYERLNGGYYVVEFPEGLGSFKNHSIARFDCDRSLLTGENEKDFTVFWEGVSDKNSINFKNSEATKNYVRKQEELTLHHEGDGFEVVDRTLHKYFRHTGEAAVLRTETKIGRRITMKEFWEHQKNIKKLF